MWAVPTRMWSGLVALAAALGMLLPGAAAEAAPAGKAVLDQYAVSCGALVVDDGGTVSFFVDREFGDHASLAYWGPGSSPNDDDPALVSAGAIISFDGRTVEGLVALADPATEAPAGQVIFRIRLDPVGERLTSRSVGTGLGPVNDNVRVLTTRQDAEVTGALVLPDSAAVELDGCDGSLVQHVVAYNNPKKFVEQPAPESSASCLLIGPAGHALRLEIFSFDGSVAELSLLASGGESELAFGFGEVTIDRSRLTSTIPLYDDGGAIGQAVITATVGKSAPRRDRGTAGDARYNVFVREQPLEGSVFVAGVGDFSLDGCTLDYQRGWIQYPNPGT